MNEQESAEESSAEEGRGELGPALPFPPAPLPLRRPPAPFPPLSFLLWPLSLSLSQARLTDGLPAAVGARPLARLTRLGPEASLSAQPSWSDALARSLGLLARSLARGLPCTPLPRSLPLLCWAFYLLFLSQGLASSSSDGERENAKCRFLSPPPPAATSAPPTPPVLASQNNFV